MLERIVSGVKPEACQRAKILGIGTSASSLSVIAVGFFRKRVGVFGPVFFIRKQLENRENAMRLLRSQLYDRALQKRKAAQAKIEAGKKKIEWGSQIRSYVFDDRRVKDHRTGFQTSDVGGVMDGKIDGFIKAYLMEFSEQDAEAK